jgi:hypothetical protein
VAERGVGGLSDACAAPVEMQPVAADSRAHGVEQRLVQVGAMDRKLRKGKAGEAARRLPIDELAEAVVEHRLGGHHGATLELVGQAELGKGRDRVREEIDPGADRTHCRRALVDPAGNAALVKAECQSQPADPGPDDQHIHGRALSPSMLFAAV